MKRWQWEGKMTKSWPPVRRDTPAFISASFQKVTLIVVVLDIALQSDLQRNQSAFRQTGLDSYSEELLSTLLRLRELFILISESTLHLCEHLIYSARLSLECRHAFLVRAQRFLKGITHRNWGKEIQCDDTTNFPKRKTLGSPLDIRSARTVDNPRWLAER